MGTLDDWKMLRQKTEQLKSLFIPTKFRDRFDTYIDNLLPILDQFIQTEEEHLSYRKWENFERTYLL